MRRSIFAISLLAVAWILDLPTAAQARAAIVGRAASTASGPHYQGCSNILTYGGNASGASFNDSAFAKAVAASAPGRICLYFPAGMYKFASASAVALAEAYPTGSVAIEGDGPDVTALNYTNGSGGIAVAMSSPLQSVHIRSIAVLAGSASTTNSGIEIAQMARSIDNPANSGLSDISFVSIHGNDGYGARNSFGTSLDLKSVSNVNIISTNIAGPRSTDTNCIAVNGGPRSISVAISLSLSVLNFCRVGFVYGDYVQGVSISQSNFTGDDIGIHQPAGTHGAAQLSVVASQFNCYAYGLRLRQAIDGVQIVANDFYVNGVPRTGGAIGISFENANSFTFSNNTFVGISTGGVTNMGIVIGAYQDGTGNIQGNTFRAFAGGAGIWLQARSRKVSLGVNTYQRDVSRAYVNDGQDNIVPANCAGPPSSAFASVSGIVTHC